MIRTVLSFRVPFNKLLDAMTWGKELIDYMKEAHPESTPEMLHERFGSWGTLHFHTDYENLAASEIAQGKNLADEKYMEIMRKASEFMVDGTLKEMLLRRPPIMD